MSQVPGYGPSPSCKQAAPLKISTILLTWHLAHFFAFSDDTKLSRKKSEKKYFRQTT